MAVGVLVQENSSSSCTPSEITSINDGENKKKDVVFKSTSDVVIVDNGRRVEIKDNAFLKTNHYIKVSRRYFSNRRLIGYCYFPGMLILLCLFFVLTIFSWYSVYLAIAMCIANIFWLAVTVQHMVVNCYTMKFVRRQKVDNTIPSLNKHYRVEVTELSGIFQESHTKHIGYASSRNGFVEFQVFHPRAIAYMDLAKKISFACFTIVICMIAFNAAALCYNVKKINPGDQFALFRGG